jgi:hypothetical protein
VNENKGDQKFVNANVADNHFGVSMRFVGLEMISRGPARLD